MPIECYHCGSYWNQAYHSTETTPWTTYSRNQSTAGRHNQRDQRGRPYLWQIQTNMPGYWLVQTGHRLLSLPETLQLQLRWAHLLSHRMEDNLSRKLLQSCSWAMLCPCRGRSPRSSRCPGQSMLLRPGLYQPWSQPLLKIFGDRSLNEVSNARLCNLKKAL